VEQSHVRIAKEDLSIIMDVPKGPNHIMEISTIKFEYFSCRCVTLLIVESKVKEGRGNIVCLLTRILDLDVNITPNKKNQGKKLVPLPFLKLTSALLPLMLTKESH
jgi:hypothetical protein